METKQFRGLDGTGILAIWSDAAPEHEEEFNNWYTNQHLRERVGVPGFRRGRRYVKDAPGELKYFTLYETADIHVLESEPYLARLNDPTDWTRRVLPFFKNGSRTAMVVASSLGAGVGGLAATIEFAPAEGRGEELAGWIVSSGEEMVKAHPALTGWHLCQSDEGVTQAKAGTEEAKASRPAGAAPSAAPPRPPRWMLMVESTERAALEAAGERLVGNSGLRGRGATGTGAFNIYRLMISLS